MQVLTTFFRRMFFVFFRRTLPASRRAKPHCMHGSFLQTQNQRSCTPRPATTVQIRRLDKLGRISRTQLMSYTAGQLHYTHIRLGAEYYD